MARVKHTNYLKATVWTPTIKMNFEGGRIAGTVEIFGTLDADQRAKALELMNRRHTYLTERETAKQQEGGAA